MSEDSKQIELLGYVQYVRGLYGFKQKANDLIIKKGQELGFNVIWVDIDKQHSLTDKWIPIMD